MYGITTHHINIPIIDTSTIPVCSMQFGKQEDAHELLHNILSKLASVLIEAADMKDQLTPSSEETTLVHHIFGGYTRSRTTCLTCNQATSTFESSLNLQLEIPSGMNSVMACMHAYFTPEILSGENKYCCDGCAKQVERATKQLSIEVAPNFLVICLKRFSDSGKISRAVAFTEQLSLDRYGCNGWGLILFIRYCNYRPKIIFIRYWLASNNKASYNLSVLP